MAAHEADAGFVAVRPPGHHATPSRAMGGCLLNNAAVCASSLAEDGERVLIVDFEVGRPEPTGVAPAVRVEIPVVGLSAGIVPVGLTARGDMEIPVPTLAGWLELGPAPGAIGPAVLVGHVDSKSGPAVFYRFTALHIGTRSWLSEPTVPVPGS